MDDNDLRKLDYEQTLDVIKQLTEIRFKLLALLPVVTGAAMSLSNPQKDPMSGLFLGLLGFFVSAGILFYDQRNTEIYEKHMHRARLLEIIMKIPSASGSKRAGGVIGGRPEGRTRALFGKIEMWHDRGLNLIYSAVIASWSYLIAASMAVLLSEQYPSIKEAAKVYAILIPLLVAVVVSQQINKLDKTKSVEIRNLKEEICAAEKKSYNK